MKTYKVLHFNCVAELKSINRRKPSGKVKSWYLNWWNELVWNQTMSIKNLVCPFWLSLFLFISTYYLLNYFVYITSRLRCQDSDQRPLGCKSSTSRNKANNVRILTKVDCECSPLNGWSVEVSVFDVQISGAHCLRTKTIEQGNFGSARNANFKKNQIFKIEILENERLQKRQ